MLKPSRLTNHVIQALKAGSSGYVPRDSQADASSPASWPVVAGERVMASAVANRVLEMLTGVTTPKEFLRRADGALRRDPQGMLATDGQQADRIQAQDHRKTVRNHVADMYEKLDIYDRAQAVLYAVRKGVAEI